MSEIGIVLCGHGTRHPDGAREFLAVAERLRERLDGHDFAPGFLELSQPSFADALDTLRLRGTRRIVVVPAMLFAAGHVKTDIPALMQAYRAEHPDIAFDYARELGVDPKMLGAAADRIAQALAGGADIPRSETLLLVAGRGSLDPDANGNVAKIARMLWEGMGFGWAETGYCDATHPALEPALEHAARLGYRRIVLFPYLLFTGVLIRRIDALVETARSRHPGIDFIRAPYLNDHPLLVEAFVDRVEEVFRGDNRMNCLTCKYRLPLPGYAGEVGLPQAAPDDHDHHHHHHAAGGR